jgi:hypothetical protein
MMAPYTSCPGVKAQTQGSGTPFSAMNVDLSIREDAEVRAVLPIAVPCGPIKVRVGLL